MTRIVVGVDGSAVAATALRWGSHIAISTETELVAVNAFQNPYSEVPPNDRQQLLEARADVLATDWIAPAVRLGATVRPVVHEGDPRQVLPAVVVEEQATLLVIGRTGAAGGPGFLHLGSVVEHLAHHGAIPLAVIPVGWSDPVRRIVVGVDGSAESLAAARWAGHLAAVTNSEIVAVHIYEPGLDWARAATEQDWRKEAESRLHEWTAPLKVAGSPVSIVAQHDLHPADGLLGVAAARQADVLVLGLRGLGRFTGARAGGVALKVVHRASLPVVLIPEQ